MPQGFTADALVYGYGDAPKTIKEIEAGYATIDAHGLCTTVKSQVVQENKKMYTVKCWASKPITMGSEQKLLALEIKEEEGLKLKDEKDLRWIQACDLTPRHFLMLSRRRDPDGVIILSPGVIRKAVRALKEDNADYFSDIFLWSTDSLKKVLYDALSIARHAGLSVFKIGPKCLPIFYNSYRQAGIAGLGPDGEFEHGQASVACYEDTYFLRVLHVEAISCKRKKKLYSLTSEVSSEEEQCCPQSKTIRDIPCYVVEGFMATSA